MRRFLTSQLTQLLPRRLVAVVQDSKIMVPNRICKVHQIYTIPWMVGYFGAKKSTIVILTRARATKTEIIDEFI